MKKLIEILDITIVSTLLLIICLLPIIYTSLPGFTLEHTRFFVFTILATILIIVNCLRIFIANKIVIPPKNIILSIVSFFIFYIISTVFSTSPTTSLFGVRNLYTGGLLYMFFLLAIFYTVIIFPKQKYIILNGILITASAVSLLGISQYYNQLIISGQWFFRVSSTIGHPVKLAFYTLSILPLSCFLFIKQKNFWLKALYFLSFFAIFLVFLFTFTRSSFLVLFLLIFLYLFFNRQVKKNIFVIPAIIFFVLTSYLFYSSIPRSFADYKKSSFYLRLTEWQAAAKSIWLQTPSRHIIGYGPDTASFFYVRPQSTDSQTLFEEIYRPSPQVRNQYLNYISSLGFLGLIIYFWFIISILRSNFETNNDVGFRQMIFFSILAILINSIFYYQTDSVILLLWIFLGLAINKTKSYELSRLPLVKPVVSMFVLVTLIVVYFVINSQIGDIQIYLDQSTENIKKVATNNLIDDNKFKYLGLQYNQEAIESLNLNKDTAKQRIILANLALKKAHSLSRYNFDYVVLLSRINYWAGVNIDNQFQKEALQWAKISISYDKNNYILWDELGLIYLNLHDLNQAEIAFNKEIQLKPSSEVAYLHMGEVLKQRGKISQAIFQYKKALSINPKYDFAKEEINKAEKLLEENSQ